MFTKYECKCAMAAYLKTFPESALLAVCSADHVHHAVIAAPGAPVVLLVLAHSATEEGSTVLKCMYFIVKCTDSILLIFRTVYCTAPA